ncbi:MAG: hypothetical protein LBT38_00385 [Deltaproteobacteria bacterium]|jgi:Rod binding domain-containing protein|nr:hypothetical protein [Deltaproteobacteria bacterium]
MSDPAPNLGSSLPLKKSTVRSLRATAARPNSSASSQSATTVKRMSVEDLRAGQNFNELINLGPTLGTMAGTKTGTSSGQNSSGALTVPALPNPLNGPSSLGSQKESQANNDQAALAAQMAQGRYFGRKTPKAETLLRNKASELTEEEKIGQLKKIKKAAEDYEGLLLKEMIKSVRQSPLAKTTGSETYSEIAEKPFTAAITAAGGLGLAERIVTDVARQEGLLETLEGNPDIMGPNYRPKISPNRMRKAPMGYKLAAEAESAENSPATTEKNLNNSKASL